MIGHKSLRIIAWITMICSFHDYFPEVRQSPLKNDGWKMTFPFGKYYFLWVILNFRSVSFCLIVLPHSLSSCHGIFSLCLYRINLFPVCTSAWPKPRKPWIYWVEKGQENKGNSHSSLKSPCIWLHVDMNTGGITLDVQICGSFVVNLIDSFPEKTQSMYYYRWWFQRWFMFIPTWGEMIQLD